MTRHADRQGYFDYPLPKFETKNSSWTAALSVPFAGTNQIGIPVEVTLVCGRVNSGTALSVRLYDVTNAAEIAKVENVTVDWPAFATMTNLQNLSEEQAVLELQIKRHSGSGKPLR